MSITVHRAEVADAPEVARLLHDFNTEFDAPTPGVEALSKRAAELLASGEITVLLGGEGPDGVAVRRLFPALWTTGLDAYLEELYVALERRRQGIGRALLEAVLETAREAGADRIDVGTEETDTAARALYESAGFTNRGGGQDGPLMFLYEREL